MTLTRKLWQMFVAEQRRTAVTMAGLMLIGMVLETVGIGLMLPLVALMTQGDLGAKYPVLRPWLVRFGNPSTEQLVMVGMLVMVAVGVVKAMFLGLLAWWQARFAARLEVSLSQRLFEGYLRQPYAFHLQRNSAQLIFNTNMQTTGVAAAVSHSLILGTELLVLAGISALLVKVEPIGALLVISTLGLASWAFYQFSRVHILRWGKIYQHHQELRIQHLQQGLGGAKDVKLLGREADFLEQYRQHTFDSARVGVRQTTLLALPRLWLELLATIGLAVLVLVMTKQGKPLETILPTLGLFAAAAFRVMPSVNRVLSALQSTRYYYPLIETLHNEFALLGQTQAPERGQLFPFERAVVLDHVSFRYPSTETFALNGVSLSIPHRCSVGFVGGSGAGKSTLVDVILGLLTPAGGSVTVDGVDIQTGLRGWQDQIGYVPQSIFLTDDTLRRNVAFGLRADQIDDAAVWRAIRAAQLDQFIGELPLGLDTVVGERGIRLSGGQRQRIGIARALYHDPAVLVLDEATSSLDSATESGFMEAVGALHGNKTLIIVSHRTSTVEHCDRLYRLERGRIVDQGDTAAVAGAIGVPSPASRR
ncbi:MAG: ABC transporter ATP-binding protein/permease [Gemmatimonadaceae bacterium]|nr:ABC transporter ATP-binding protein/permease [Gemmatimonadaceae bacterium]